MRKPAAYVVAWFAAGVAAVSLATAGVSMVGNQVTGSRPAPLSAAEVQAELTGDATTTTATPTPDPSGGSTTTGPAATTPIGGPSTSVDGPGTTPTTAAPAAVPSPTTTVPPSAPPETRTYTLVGGTATLRFASSGVTVVVASPNAGYAVDVEETHGNGVRVEFSSDEHRSRVEGWWDGGPQDETEEQD